MRWKSPGQMPNGLQASPEGLWVIDQVDPNDIYLLAYEDGRELRRIPTRALHSSGITVDPTVQHLGRLDIHVRGDLLR